MATFVMFGKFSASAAGKISADRTQSAVKVIGDCGGKIKDWYVLLGETDLVGIVEFPGVKEAMKASVGLTKLLGISFTTAPAVTVDEFDKLVAG